MPHTQCLGFLLDYNEFVLYAMFMLFYTPIFPLPHICMYDDNNIYIYIYIFLIRINHGVNLHSANFGFSVTIIIRRLIAVTQVMNLVL